MPASQLQKRLGKGSKNHNVEIFPNIGRVLKNVRQPQSPMNIDLVCLFVVYQEKLFVMGKIVIYSPSLPLKEGRS